MDPRDREISRLTKRVSDLAGVVKRMADYLDNQENKEDEQTGTLYNLARNAEELE